MSHRRRRDYEPLWRFRLLLQTCTAWQDAFDSRQCERDQAGCGSEDGCGFGGYGGGCPAHNRRPVFYARREIKFVWVRNPPPCAGFGRPEGGIDEGGGGWGGVGGEGEDFWF